MDPIPFVKTETGLVAENRAVRLVLSPIGAAPEGDGVLLEQTAYNLLVRRLQGNGGLRLEIDSQAAEPPAFLREGNSLWGRLDTGGRPGRIPLTVYLDNAEALRAHIDVRPALLDYETHFQAMRTDLERICRALAFTASPGARTQARAERAEPAPLDFLQIAQTRLDRLLRLLRDILARPHRQLATRREIRPVSLARGHDPDAVLYLLRNPAVWTPLPDKPGPLVPLTAGNRRFGYTALQETLRYPDTNTPPNRFLVTALNRLTRRAQTVAQTLDRTHGAYRNLCDRIRTRLGRILREAPLHSVPQSGPAEPRPLHLDARYAAALSLCRELEGALAPCAGSPFDLSYRDTATLYEYWTWLSLTESLLTLGFTPEPGAADRLFHLSRRGLTVRPVQGEASVISLADPGGLTVCVLYNKTYAAREGRSLTHDLRPDIVLELHEPGSARSLFAFDAKYRRQRAADETCWIPLPEDIDKMHTYRDAVGQATPQGFQRALQAAVVLFPAPDEPAYHNHRFYRSLPYGIGALPLLPGNPETLTRFRRYLRRLLDE